MSEFSKFDTHIHNEESEYEPTAADWADYDAYLDACDEDYQQPEDDQLLQIVEEQERLVDDARDEDYYGDEIIHDYDSYDEREFPF